MREHRLLRLVFRLPTWLQNLGLALAGVLAALLAGPFAISHAGTLLQLAVTLLVMLPGFIMAAVSSDRIVPYVLLIWVIGPELRRLSDWMLGFYDSVNLISLAPVLTTSLLFVSFMKKPFSMLPAASASVRAFALPYVYAAAIGLVFNKLAGIYSMLNYFAPVLILVYLAAKPSTARQKEAWIRFYVTTAVLLSVYAWFQYLTLPPWDRLWMEGAQMVSMGLPEPMMFRAFSTLNSNGTFAVFLTAALVPAIVNRRWRGFFGIAGVLVMVSALAITLVRASWVTLIVGIVAYLLFASGAGRWKMFATVAAIAAVGSVALPLLPGGQQMTDRVATLGELQNDQSANTRWLLLLYALPEIARNPLGGGFGSIGKSAALNGDAAAAGLGSVDNGYLGVFATFGVPGGLLFFRALAVHWRMAAGQRKSSLHRALALTTIVQLWIGFLFGGELVGLGAVHFWLFTSLALEREKSASDA